MFRCPHCEKPGISPLRKTIISPGMQAVCKACGGSSTLRYAGWLATMLPGSVLMIAALFVSSESLEWGLNISGFLLMVAVPLLFAPLHKELPESA